MVQLVKILAAWSLTLLTYATVATMFVGQRGASMSQIRVALLGIGLVVGLPTLAFALLVAWPIAAMLRAVDQPWSFVLGSAALFGLAMLFLTAMIIPDDWKGAGLALVAFAALLGLVWGIISLLTTPAARVG
jgi:hypothetical protein